MPTGMVQAPATGRLSDADEECIRAHLHQLSEDERAVLWTLLVALDQAVADGDVAGVHRIVTSAPYGPLRACVAQLAGRRLDPLYESLPVLGTPGSPRTRQGPTPRHVLAHVGAVGQWADRRTHWLTFDQDLDRRGWEWWRHEPRPVHWRHRPMAIGLTRRLEVDNHGDLRAELELAAGRVGDLVGSLCAERAVGFSVGVHDGRNTFDACYDPHEWCPSEGRADLVRVVRGRLAEVSVTPSPLFAGTGVERTW
jgi:hypothetical protein